MRTYLVCLLIVGLLALGCVQNKSPSSKSVLSDSNLSVNESLQTSNISVTKEVGPCSDQKNVLLSDGCFFDYAKSHSDVSYCERIYMINKKDECYMNFASSNEDLCQKIVSSQLRSDCYYAHARLSNNTDLCVKISNSTQKDACLRELSPPCSFESDEYAKTLCLATYHNSSSFCSADDQCLFDLGVKNKNSASCAQISNSSRALRLACNAVVNNNPLSCNETGIDVVADYCYQIYAYSTSNYMQCVKASSGSIYRAQCLTHFASANNDASICKYSSSELERDNCYMNYSITTGNYSVCDLIKVSLLDSQCRISTALKNGDMSSCNKLLYSSRTNCFNLVLSGSIPIKSLQSCLDIADDDADPWEYRCLSDFAHKSSNESVCDLIPSSKYHSECEFRFS